MLGRVTRSVNAAIRPLTDKAHWDVEDRWDFAEDGSGDCEDYQLVKRERLAALGVPRRALRMTVVLDGNGDGHAVLTVRTDRGDLILDNMTNAVLRWDETGYRFFKRERTDTPGWETLDGAYVPLMLASSVRPPGRGSRPSSAGSRRTGRTR